MAPAVVCLESECVECRFFGGVVWGKDAAPCKGTGSEPVLLHGSGTTTECHYGLKAGTV